MFKRLGMVAAALVMLAAAPAPAAHAAAPVEYYRLAPGFLSESWDSDGVPLRDGGFATPKPWGFYTAYLMQTNDKGQRTWRIEKFLNSTRITYRYAQGSTMWVFEGSQKALLVRTAQKTAGKPNLPGPLHPLPVGQ